MAIVLTIAPALNPDGRRAYCSRGPLFVGMVHGRRVIERSPQPLIDTCRCLLDEGEDPKTPIVMRHGQSSVDALKLTVGVAARLDVQDTKLGKPVFRPWKPPPGNP